MCLPILDVKPLSAHLRAQQDLRCIMKKNIIFLLVFILAGQTAWAGRAPIKNIAADPYVSALLIDAETGEHLFADNIDAPVYPASALKLMVLLVLLEHIEQGKLKLDDMVGVTKEAARMGGSQVYLDPKEQFPVEDLLYALMVQSANDAAVTLATHVAGSKEGFVALMNRKAEELGMKNTRFHSVHGLPPSEGQEVDVTTARDFAILSRDLARRGPGSGIFVTAHLSCAPIIILSTRSMAATVLKLVISRQPAFPSLPRPKETGCGLSPLSWAAGTARSGMPRQRNC
jgi:D-alanyl-D-alanine carboxypeptidase